MLAALLPVALVRGAPSDEALARYDATHPTDAVTAVQTRLDQGTLHLKRDEQAGYLASVLQAFGVPVSSQTLVFSKTSFQRQRISPQNPRALYFNDDVYIGYVRGGEVLEVAAADPKLGATFYTLDQHAAGKPTFVRQSDSCLQCHAGSMTRDMPGFVMRSVFPDRAGQPIYNAGTFVTTDESPFSQRWGGWYVTGTHGRQRHMGNAFARDGDDAGATFDRSRGANVTRLTDRFDPVGYLTPDSDIVALMVLAHQTEAHNRIAQAALFTEAALRDEQVMNDALGRGKNYRADSTTSRIASACEPLVKCLLFSGAAPLTDEVKGTTTFAHDYAARGPRDQNGRSLRDLDLHRRLLRYPCSPLIYSDAFNRLPDPARQYVYRRLWEILTGRDIDKAFAHLSDDDRLAIYDILRATKPDLPKYWKPTR